MAGGSEWGTLVSLVGDGGGGGGVIMSNGAPERSAVLALEHVAKTAMRPVAERVVVMRCCKEVVDVHLPAFAAALLRRRGGGGGDACDVDEEEGSSDGVSATNTLRTSLEKLVQALDTQAAWVRCLGTHVKRELEEEVAALLLRRMPEELPRLLRAHYREMIDASIADHHTSNDEDEDNEEEDDTMNENENEDNKEEEEDTQCMRARDHDNLTGGKDDDDDDDDDDGGKNDEKMDSGDDEQNDNNDDMCDISKSMRRLGLGNIGDEACSSSLSRALDDYVEGVAKETFEEAALPAARRWLRQGPFKLLRRVLPRDDPQSQRHWRSRLEFHLLEALGNLRTEQMFSIVVDYPESKPAIDDLRACMDGTGRTKQLVAAFCAAIRKRLLHPGATTATILRVYVDVIRVMKDLDSTGVLLDAVGAPIQEYLRGRADAIRCIVTMLTEGDDGSSLLEDIGIDAADAKDGAGDIDIENEDAFAAAMRWEPDALDAVKPGGLAAARDGDVVSMLVGVYGSKELFVNEYRSLLAEKLLSRGIDYDTSNELHAMELLKLRFGETSMHNCDVMLRDLAESKRINANVRQELPADGNQLSATIISYLFWPQLTGGEKLNLPPRVANLLDRFASKYHELKTPRKLEWRPHLGVVELDLAFEDGRELSFSVSPALAALMMYFEERSVWPIDELASTMGISEDVLRKRAAYWIGHGVLVEEEQTSASVGRTGVATVATLRSVETASEAAAATTSKDIASLEENAENASAIADTSDQDAAVYEGYIIGMLTNFSSLSVDRIHNMLKMFMPEYDKNERQLSTILRGMVASDKLVFDDDGLYKKA